MHQTDLVVKDEEARRLKLRVIVLRDEAAALRDQLSDKDSKLYRLSQQHDDIRVQLDHLSQTCANQETQLRSQARQQSELKVQLLSRRICVSCAVDLVHDADRLQAELLSASNMSEDSAKILSEKLALTRELAVLKPEIEHLRSQLSHQKDVLSEKLALERQLSTLEVELANEKRAVLKAKQRHESQDNEIEGDLRQQVNDLEAKLAAEQKKSAAQAKKLSGKQKSEAAQDETQTAAMEELRQQVADLQKEIAAEQRAKKGQSKGQSGAEGELRKQVADLEKRLADEKCAAQKTKRSQDSDDQDASGELQQQVGDLESQLASEKREAEQARKALEKEAAAARDQIDMLTQRVEEFKRKLRETRAELKEVRGELTQARTTALTSTTSVPVKSDDGAKKPLSRTKGAKKRRGNEISVDDMMLDTPGHEEGRKRLPKKRGVEVTTVGEKSTFSITPFLEKSNTINLAATIEEEDEEPSILVGKGDSAAPIIEPEAETTEEVPANEKPAPQSVAKALKATKAKSITQKPRAKPKAQALAESSPNKIAAAPPKVKSAENPATLEKVVEQPEEASEATAAQKAPASKKTAPPAANFSVDNSNTSSDNPEPKKKRRKLLGASNKGTLFDKDEDAGEPEAAVPTVIATATKRKPVGLKASSTRKGPVSTLTQGAFGGKAFSPLKKDRRGVGASFLA